MQFFVPGFLGVITLVFIAAWVAILYYSLRMLIRKRKDPDSHPTVGVLHGAWQGHALGTSTYEPGSLPRLERELLAEEDGFVVDEDGNLIGASGRAEQHDEDQDD